MKNRTDSIAWLVAGFVLHLGNASRCLAYYEPCEISGGTAAQYVSGSLVFVPPDSDVSSSAPQNPMLYSPTTDEYYMVDCTVRSNVNGDNGCCGTPGAGDVGQPINPMTGAMYHDEVDIYSDSGLLPLVVSRRYTSSPRANTPFRKMSSWTFPEVSGDPLVTRVVGTSPLPQTYVARARNNDPSAPSAGGGCTNYEYTAEEAEHIGGIVFPYTSIDPFFDPVRLSGESLGQGWGEFYETSLYPPGSLFWYDPRSDVGDTWSNLTARENALAGRGDTTFAIRQPAAGYGGGAGWHFLDVDGQKHSGWRIGEHEFSNILLGVDSSSGAAVFGPCVSEFGLDAFCRTKSFSPYDTAAGEEHKYTYVTPDGMRYTFGKWGRLELVELLGANQDVVEGIKIEAFYTDESEYAADLDYKKISYTVGDRPFLILDYDPGTEYQPVMTSATLFDSENEPVRRAEYTVENVGSGTIPHAQDLRLIAVTYFDYESGVEVEKNTIIYDYDYQAREMIKREEYSPSAAHISSIEWQIDPQPGSVGEGDDRHVVKYVSSSQRDYTGDYDRDKWSVNFEVVEDTFDSLDPASYLLVHIWEQGTQPGEKRNSELRWYDRRFNRMLAKLELTQTPIDGLPLRTAWANFPGVMTYYDYFGHGANDGKWGDIRSIYKIVDGESPSELPTCFVTQFGHVYGRNSQPHLTEVRSGMATGDYYDWMMDTFYESGSRVDIDRFYGSSPGSAPWLSFGAANAVPWTYSGVIIGPQYAMGAENQTTTVLDTFESWRTFLLAGGAYPFGKPIDLSPRNIISVGSRGQGAATDPSVVLEPSSSDGVHVDTLRVYAWNSAAASPGWSQATEAGAVEEDDVKRLQLVRELISHFPTTNSILPDSIETREYSWYGVGESPNLSTARRYKTYLTYEGSFQKLSQLRVENLAGPSTVYESGEIVYDEFGRVESYAAPDNGPDSLALATYKSLNEIEHVVSIIETTQGLVSSTTSYEYDDGGRVQSITDDSTGELPSQTRFGYDDFGYLDEVVSQLKTLNTATPPAAADDGTLGIQTVFNSLGTVSSWKVGMGSGSSNPTTYSSYESIQYPDPTRSDELVKTVKDREQMNGTDLLPGLDTVVEPHGTGSIESIRLRDGTTVDPDPMPQPHSSTDIALTPDISNWPEDAAWQLTSRFLNSSGVLVEKIVTLFEMTDFGRMLPRAVEGPGGRVEFYFYHDDARLEDSGTVSNYGTPITGEQYTTPLNPLEAELSFAKAPWLTSGQSVKVGTSHYEYEYDTEQDGRLHTEVLRSANNPTTEVANILDKKRIFYDAATGRVSRIVFEMGTAPGSEALSFLLREIRYTYDARGQVTQREHRVAEVIDSVDVTQPFPGLPVFRELIEYDGAGRIIKMTYAEPDTFTPTINLPWRIYTYKYRTDGLLDSIIQWGGSAIHWDSAPNPDRAVVAVAHSALGVATESGRPGVFRKFKYDSFGRLLKEDRYYVIDELTINDDPLAAEKRIQRTWEYSYSLDGVMMSWTETQAWPVAGWSASGLQSPSSKSFNVEASKFNQLLPTTAYQWDTLGAATQFRDAATKFAHSPSQDFTLEAWDRLFGVQSSFRKRVHDPMGRLVADETLQHDNRSAAIPGGTNIVKNRTLFQYQGWNLVAEHNVATSGTSPDSSLRWRYYHEGGLDSAFGGSYVDPVTGSKNFYAFTDHLGSVVALMELQEKEFYPDPEDPPGGGENMMAGSGEENGMNGGESMMGGGVGPTLRWSLVPVEVMEYTPYGLPTIHVPDNQGNGTGVGHLVSATDGAQLEGSVQWTGANNTALEPRFGPTPASGQNPFTCQSSFGWRFLFAGREWDSGNRTYWNRYRVYAPEECRFLSRDPLGYVDSLDQYAYCAGDPVNWRDASGLHIGEDLSDLMDEGIDWLDCWGQIDPDSPMSNGFVGTLSDILRGYSDVPRIGSDFRDYFERLGAGEYDGRFVDSFIDLKKAELAEGLRAASILPGVGFLRLKLNSFTADTEVATPLGFLPISGLHVGDSVLAMDPETGTVEEAPVIDVIQSLHADFIEVKTSCGSILSTSEHPFWVEGQGWVNAEDLRPGDMLESVDGSLVAVTLVDFEPHQAAAYNLEVAGIHTYFAGDMGVLVHNGPKLKLKGKGKAAGAGARGWKNATGPCKQCPSPNGRKGGPAHQQKVAEVEKQIKKRKNKFTTEEGVDTAGGFKDRRFVDVVEYFPDGTKVYHQIGLFNKSGNPVPRELRAMIDLHMASGGKAMIRFHPYN